MHSLWILLYTAFGYCCTWPLDTVVHGLWILSIWFYSCPLHPLSICKSNGLSSVLSLCYPYLSSGQTSIFYNQTYSPNSAALPSYFNTIGMLAQNMSGCADIAKELLCFSMFPYCDPTSSEPRPLPVCSQTCNAFTQGQCGALFNSSDLYTLMMSNCGLSTPVAGNLPECIMSSKLSGT